MALNKNNKTTVEDEVDKDSKFHLRVYNKIYNNEGFGFSKVKDLDDLGRLIYGVIRELRIISHVMVRHGGVGDYNDFAKEIDGHPGFLSDLEKVLDKREADHREREAVLLKREAYVKLFEVVEKIKAVEANGQDASKLRDQLKKQLFEVENSKLLDQNNELYLYAKNM